LYRAGKCLFVDIAVAAIVCGICARIDRVDEVGALADAVSSKTGNGLGCDERRRDEGKKDGFELSN
jgi:hypothetical protein